MDLTWARAFATQCGAIAYVRRTMSVQYGPHISTGLIGNQKADFVACDRLPGTAGYIRLVHLYSYSVATGSPGILPDDEGGARLATMGPKWAAG